MQLALRRSLPELQGRDFAWVPTPEGVLGYKRGDITVMMNSGVTPAELPNGEVLISSAPLENGALVSDAVAWIRTASLS